VIWLIRSAMCDLMPATGGREFIYFEF